MLYKAAIGYLSMNTSTSLIVSVIVALFLAAWMIAGYIRGFLRVLLTTFFLVITLILSASLAGPAAAFLREHTSVDDKIGERICKYIDSRLYGEADDDISDSGSQSETADNIYTEEISKDDMYARAGSDADDEKSFIDSLALPSFLKTELRENNTIQRYTELGVSTFRAYISSQLSAVILKAICYIVLTIAVAVILKIISGALGLINRIPVIGGINRLLGGFLGLLEGLLILWCICIFIMIFSGTSFGTSCMSVIRSSGLLSVIYDYNLPVNAFKALFRL